MNEISIPGGVCNLGTKTMYHGEKFLPAECPKCRAKFEKQNADWTLLLGDIIDGKKVVRETTGYDIIICAHCENYTARRPMKSFSVGDKALADKLVAEEGYVNLQEVTAVGNMAKDHFVVHGVEGPSVRDGMK